MVVGAEEGALVKSSPRSPEEEEGMAVGTMVGAALGEPVDPVGEPEEREARSEERRRGREMSILAHTYTRTHACAHGRRRKQHSQQLEKLCG